MHSLIAVRPTFAGWYFGNSKMKDLMKEGFVSCTETSWSACCSSASICLLMFSLLMRVTASSFASDGMQSQVIKLAGKQKLGEGCNDSSCCPTSSLGQIYCASWSQLIPQRSSIALLQPLRCWIMELFLKINLWVLYCATRLCVCVCVLQGEFRGNKDAFMSPIIRQCIPIMHLYMYVYCYPLKYNHMSM